MVAPAVIKAVPALQQDVIDNLAYGYSNRSIGFMFGKRTATVQNTRVDIWEGPTANYVFPPTGLQLAIVSTSANDAAGNTGIQSVILEYLDSNYVERTEIVALNGLTPVNTVATNIFRINGFHAIAVGSALFAQGNISATNGGVTYGFIGAAENTSRTATFTIPAGKTGYVSHWQASSGAATGTHFTQITLRATAHLGVSYGTTFLAVDEVGSQNNGLAITFPTPIRMPEKTDVKVTAVSDAASANVTVMVAAMGWLEW